MRLATYNVEWFHRLFARNGTLLEDGEWSARYNVTRADQLTALGIVFTAMDADAVMVIEAPDGHAKRSTITALENFATRYDLRTNRAITGFISDTQQEIALLYDPLKLTVVHDPQGEATGKKGATGAPRFDGAFRWDLDVDATPEIVSFSKPPLELAVTTVTGTKLRLIGAHVKSKAPHGARTPEEIIRLSIENRRKQLAQCIWLRNRVVEHLKSGDSVVVMGDLNDGPGLDEYEKLFGRSGVEIVMGEEGDNCLFDPNARARLHNKTEPGPTTSRFYIPHEKRWLETMLDYAMVSADLRKKSPKWRIWHPSDDAEIAAVPELQNALLTASDHFPVTIDLDI